MGGRRVADGGAGVGFVDARAVDAPANPTPTGNAFAVDAQAACTSACICTCAYTYDT